MAIAAQNNGLGGGRPGEGAGIANLLFVIPALTLYALFVLWPLASSLYYSLTDWDGIGAPRWVGIVTPLGGLAFIAGWIALGLSLRRGNA